MIIRESDNVSEKVFEEVVPRCETKDCGGLVKPGKDTKIFVLSAFNRSKS